jgi:hypothetical protein
MGNNSIAWKLLMKVLVEAVYFSAKVLKKITG